MEILGFTGNAVKKKTVALERESGNIELEITALPPSYMEAIGKALPEPVAPLQKIPARNPSNGKFLIDQTTGAKIFPPNINDPMYLKNLMEHQNLTTVAIVHYAIKDDENVSFETEADGKQFYIDVRDELESFGFNMGDLAQLVKEVIALTGLSEEELDEAKDDFLDQKETDGMETDSD